MINFLYRFLEKVTKIKNNIYIKKYEQLSKCKHYCPIKVG